MKKTTFKLLPFFLVLLLTAAVFTACIKDEPKIEDLPEEERAAAVLTKANAEMENIKSYRAEEKMDFAFTLNNQSFLIKYLSTMYITDINTENYAETTESEYGFYLGGTKKDGNTTIEGFRDGVMFLSSVNGLNKSSLKSELTLEEYKNHVEAMSKNNDAPDFEIFLSEAKNKSAEKQEDGSWIVSFSEPSKASLKNFSDAFEDITEALGGDIEITDISCELAVTSIFLIDKLEFTVLLDSKSIGGATPISVSKKDTDTSMTISVEFFDYGSAEQPNNIRLDKYTDVPDLRKLYEIENSLGELIEKETGSFSLDIKHTAEVFNDKDTYREKDVCEYKNGAYGFSFELYNESDGKNYIIEYENGKQTLSSVGASGTKNEIQKVDSTDFEQRKFIEGMLDEGNLSKTNVANFTKKEKDGNFIYEFTSTEPNDEVVDSIVSSLKATDCTGKETITVELDADGNIVKYNYDVALTLECSSNNSPYTVTYVIKVECIYGTTLADVNG